MTDNYHHSVSNKLVLNFCEGQLKWTICDRTFVPVLNGESLQVDRENIFEAIKNTPVLNNIYASIHLLISGSSFTLVPNQFGNLNEREKFYKLNHPRRQTDLLLADALTASIENIFSLPEYLNQSFRSLFPTIAIHHETSIFYRWVNLEFKSKPNHIFAFHRKELLLLVVYKDDTLLLMNDFPVSNDQDLFYFVMATIEQLELNPEQLSLQWYEESTDDSTDKVETMFKNHIAVVSNKRVLKKGEVQQSLSTQIFVACES